MSEIRNSKLETRSGGGTAPRAAEKGTGTFSHSAAFQRPRARAGGKCTCPLFRRRLQRSTQRGGFTLVEIIISIGIFALGMVGVLSMFSFAARSHRQAMDDVEVAMLAQDLVTQYAAVLDNSTNDSADEFNTANITQTRQDEGVIKLDNGQPDPRFADDRFVMSANYPRLWYSVTLTDISYPDIANQGGTPTGVGNAARLVIKISGYPRSPNAGDQVQRFETVIVRKPHFVAP